jgi:hypothetical protein
MSATRRLFEPKPATVRVNGDGAPCAVGPLAVESVREDWVVGPIGWYTGHPVRRRYYQLVLANGRCTTVFRDLRCGRWYQQGN